MTQDADITETSMAMFYFFKNNLASSGLYLFSGENLRTQHAKAHEGKGALLELLVKQKEGENQYKPTIHSILLIPEVKPHTYKSVQRKMVENFEKKRYTVPILNIGDNKSRNRVEQYGFKLQEQGVLSLDYKRETLYNIIKVNLIEKFLSTQIRLGGYEGRFIQYYQPPKTILKEGLRSYFLTPVRSTHGWNNTHKYIQEMDMYTGNYMQNTNKRNQYILTGTPLKIEPIPQLGQKLVGKIVPLNKNKNSPLA